MASTLFSTAKTVVPAPKNRLKAAGAPKIELKGLELYTCYDVIAKWLEGHMKTAKAEIIALAKPKFIKDGAHLKAQPPSFDAAEGISVGNIQSRKRGTNSALSELEREALAAHDIPVGEVRDVIDTFIFNPELSQRIKDDPKLAERISKALSGVKGIGVDPIQTQVSTVKYVVSDETVSVMWRKSLEVIAEVFDIVMTPAIRPKLAEGSTTKDAFDKVSEFLLLTGEDPEKKVEKAVK